MTTKKPASAGRKTVAKTPVAPRVIEGVTLIRMPMEENKPSHPAAEFKGKAPAAGETIEFTLKNGVTYRGVVAEAVEAKEEVFAEFSQPLTIVPKD